MNTGVICGVRVSHNRASVEEIELAGERDSRTIMETLLTRDGITESFAIQTCNRSEAYVVADGAVAGRRALASFAPDVRDGAVVDMSHEESLRHLLRVATGLESLVLGEDQILGQFKRAIEVARGIGALGPMLEAGVTKAIHVGERARSETSINEGAVSIGSAAVRLAGQSVGLNGRKALVIGAGEMGSLVAESLASTNISEVVIANRTIENAESIAETINSPAYAVSLDSLTEVITEASIIMTATGYGKYLIEPTDIDGAGETFIIDLAQPRNVHPATADIENAIVQDIDALESITKETEASRQAAAREVDAMIDEEFDRLLESYKRQRADEAISEMYEAAEHVKRREVETALEKLEKQGTLTDNQRETVSSMADTLINQLLAAPTKSLRDAAAEDDWTTIQTAMTLFDPNFGGDTPQPDRPDDIPRAAERGDISGDDLPDDVPNHIAEKVSDG
ncbi:glutamyl-tRNA reductase [Haloquadratum walsbyi]|jgi:glutamyl-tRNA reductase|uniref:glutamyl-tRNA reductase n=1 Tax=Haloquadratum walsbyi TaxID=293091 RepID=UPI0015F6B985|nr:glutamyl-tRNA reductase [Haloquadratum walsbyi]